MYECVYPRYVWVPNKVRRRHQIPRSCSLQLQAVGSHPKRVLGTDLRSSGRAINILNSWTISPWPVTVISFLLWAAGPLSFLGGLVLCSQVFENTINSFWYAVSSCLNPFSARKLLALRSQVYAQIHGVSKGRKRDIVSTDSCFLVHFLRAIPEWL